MAWRRQDQRQNRWSFWGATVCMMALLTLGTTLLTSTSIILTSTSFFKVHRKTYEYSYLLLMTAVFILSGWITGLIFSRRALAGVAVGTVIQCVWDFDKAAFSCIHSGKLLYLLAFAGILLGIAAMTVLSAWGGSHASWFQRRWRAMLANA